ncbi:carboxypeptidase-like regulatory domain-containing protein [Flammeovirga kamogawensis]|uniref:Carboxypeptidase-like regulatory domain-containing protein n=1 Tax=Flammeovirga kamogawensis TaxID=373891 RepID=A0ABX8GTC8_9BACT|nr:carboxypeptidase-like regulatory domain-containing protein [Flammeovirga kamogawensis]MBB6460107.1 hypothetical protein [Flammeovirga kamogawensis]QWG06850.1 carboxypeptidase-like regulatory domain-containing protein [Flammeovirga kamogawensis]TRX68672.1 hypothetical protein EO216_11290 [Flammeovirga kamogawensis]
MKTGIKLTIDQRCNADTKDFKPTRNGGFCLHCQKEVINFKDKSDKEIINYFNNTRSVICGRFQPKQLKEYQFSSKDLTIVKEKRTWFSSLAAITFLSVLPFTDAKSQELKTNVSISSLNHIGKRVEGETQDDTQRRITVVGVVKDKEEYFDVLPGVNVFIKGTSISTITNLDGKFKLENVPIGSEIEFMFIGYENLTFKVKNTEVKEIELMMDQSQDWLGNVQVHEIYTSNKKTFWQRIKGIF